MRDPRLTAKRRAATAEAVAGWLADCAMPLATVAPRSGFADLEALTGVLEGVRIVGLGEATHGTREFFLLKHRLVEFLVQRLGFTVFAIESDQAACAALERYVRDGEGDASRALAGQGYWTWDTREVLGMVRWMREHNCSVPEERKVRFVGIDAHGRGVPRGDAERELRMAQTAQGILAEQPPGARMALWAHNAHVSTRRLGKVLTMGGHLRDRFEDAYYALGLTFGEGTFRALPLRLWRGPVERVVGPPKADSLEWYLSHAELGDLLVDLRERPADPAVRRWLTEPRPMRCVGAIAPRWLNRFSYVPTRPAAQYDGLVYLEQTTRARPNPRARAAPADRRRRARKRG
jgi:erythromycin esterase-like protein